MGIVRKQSTYSSLFTYLGISIGAINTLILFPAFFLKEDFGLTRIMIEFATLFSAFSTLGSLNGLYKFYPFYKSYLPPNKNDLPFITIMVNLIGCFLFVVGALVFQPYLARKFGNNSPLFVEHYRLVIPFTVSLSCFLVLEGFCWVIKKTIASNLVKELFYRITVSVLICLYIFKVISRETFFKLFAFSYLPALLILAFVIFKNGSIPLYRYISKATRRLHKKMLIYVSYHYTGLLISILPRTIDGILIAGLSNNGLVNLALYSIPTYLVAIMEVPQRSMAGIATTLIAEAWKENNKVQIASLYKKSSLNLLVIGLGLFGLMLPNLHNVVHLMGPQYRSEYHIILLIFIFQAFAKLVDLGMGLNAQILLLSKYWRVDFYTSLFFIFINCILDFILIKKFGLIGAAYGSGIALVSYNLLRCFYLWYLYKLHPFSPKTFASIGIAAIGIVVVFLIPFLGNIYFDTIVRCLVFSLIYLPAILYFKISQDISDLFYTALNKIIQKK